MTCPAPSRVRHPVLRRRFDRPWGPAARQSKALHKWCADHKYLTPHFSVAEMADTETGQLPLALRAAARRHCFNLEQLRRSLSARAGHPVVVSIDGPYRTEAHNREVHGALHSQHVQGCATDHFRAQVNRWCREARLSLSELVALCDAIFRGVGNETSGTLHLDSRTGPKARFVTWVGQ